MKKNRITVLTVLIGFFLVCAITFVITLGQVNRNTLTDNTTESGVVGSVVYLNDAIADYYYYTGLNYTNGTSLPSGNNQNIYNDNNLVRVNITYSSVDPTNNLKGYVSLNEMQDTYVYYKVYPINDNGTDNQNDDYVLIELIDNPFTNRPNDRGFNGWISLDNEIDFSLDVDYYTRYAKVPITYTDGNADVINVTFNASWAPARVGELTSDSNQWGTAFSKLKDYGLQQLDGYVKIYADYDMSGYYHQENVGFYGTCSGMYNSSGHRQNNNCRCTSWNGCTYYSLIENENFQEDDTYYQLTGGSMQLVDNSTIDRTVIGGEFRNGFSEDSNMAGYFRKKVINHNESYGGLYDKAGNFYESGTCSSSTCTYYELIKYYDEENNPSKLDKNTDYYYLSTRDTNIIVMRTNMSSAWSSSEDRPFTLTSLHNGVNYSGSYTWTVNNTYVICYDDTTIENIRINSGRGNGNNNPSSSNTGTRTIYGNRHNLKLGRGILRNGTNTSFASIVGGYNQSAGSSSNIIKYKLTVESGFYDSLSLTNGANTTTSTRYTTYDEARGTYGNDYDRATKNNNLLDFYYCLGGSWGYLHYASTLTGISFDVNVKSGSFGTGKVDNTAGIYVGGRYGGIHYTSRRIKIDGGWIYNLIGGPLTATNRGNYNDSYIYMTGGRVEMITGGAGTTATYGNRIIQVTGGTIGYSVFGGSNGYDANEGDGTVNGSSFIYIGGKAVIGDENNASSLLWGAESGSVFGIGNGKKNYSTIGSSDNSHIIIADEALVLGNVYGGGNYGAVGVSSQNNQSNTTIDIIGGTVNGSVYGGGNNNGAGSDSKTSEVVINMTGGTIQGAIYGGSRATGTIYGTTEINIDNGTVGSIYGGGEGGKDNTIDGTFVGRDVTITVGKNGNPTITGSVYGGSAFGTVNDTTDTNASSTYKTTVNVYNGDINNVFGGGQGDSNYTPHVVGDITVNVYDGNIENVYGGNDMAGTSDGAVRVYLNGGHIKNTFGGGNQTDLNNSEVYLRGAQATNIYGGSNQSGLVRTSNVEATSGTAVNIFGGNNIDGNTSTANVKIDGATVTNVYGGGNKAATDETFVTLVSGKVTNVYGGGEEASVYLDTTIKLQGGEVTTIYGGSNSDGTVRATYITTTGGQVNTIYGGNNLGGKSTTTNITANGGSIYTIFGGGNEADSTTSNININLVVGKIDSIYGGGNKASVDTTNIIIAGANSGNVYGGSNKTGDVITSNITTTDGIVTTIYGGNNEGGKTETTIININGGTIDTIFGGGNEADSTTSNINIVSASSKIKDIFGGGNAASVDMTHVKITGANSGNVYGGSNSSGTVLESHIEVTENPSIDNVFGGNNKGGITNKTNVDIKSGNIINVYGGGNDTSSGTTKVSITGATITGNVYGGGNGLTALSLKPEDEKDLTEEQIESLYQEKGMIAVVDSTDLDIINATINGDVFGGGNAGIVNNDTDVYIEDAKIGSSVYAGGNGKTAFVYGNSLLNIGGATEVANHVFGGGNAAKTGQTTTNNSNTVVNIAGGNIGGNVYGGANTSTVYGTVLLNIGYKYNHNLKNNNIIIAGTVFGGGEANASGSENYDFSHIGVTVGITINIDGLENDILKISGSIFGSGNASSTSGYSNINISNYGKIDNVLKNISIQRTQTLTIDNSYIELIGATDRTNEYKTTLFTLSRIDELILKNNSNLYAQTGFNLVKKFTSLAGDEKAAVKIQDGVVTKNVDNRLYAYEGKNLNISTSENANSSYGEVSGMTFFGMYIHDRNGNVNPAYYSPKYNYGDTVQPGEFYTFSDGSYVLGLHYTNHDIEVDGFYSHYEQEENQGHIDVKYIIPTPDNAQYYMWAIGVVVSSYEFDMTASKFSTLGIYELPLINHPSPNTTFSILGFNFNGLASDFELVDEESIPRIALDGKADTRMGLSVKTSNTGWMTVGETSFYTDESKPIVGTTNYKSENSNVVPSLLFYLHHSKNLETSGEIGTVVISLVAVTPINDLENDVERINIEITLNRQMFNTNDYEGSMAAGEEFKMFAPTSRDITSKSKLSAYYSLYVDKASKFYKDGYNHALVSSFVFPADTKITMIDLTTNEYYYYVITDEDVANANAEFNNNSEASYKLSKFIKMGSSSYNNNYDDAIGNSIYYQSEGDYIYEEFIFIVDFAESNIVETQLDNILLMELRDKNDETLVSVLGIQHDNLKYNLYADQEAVIEIDANLNKDNIYLGEDVTLDITTNFVQQINETNTIYDTNYFNKKLGVKLSIYDSKGKIVNGTSLLGVNFKYDGVTYYPRVDGTLRFNLAERVANVSSKITINTTNSNLPSDTYTIKIESFGSADGIYYGLISSDEVSLNLSILNKIYGLNVTLSDTNVIIDKDTGLTSANNNALTFNIDYASGLVEPNIRMSLYRRKYDEVYSAEYELVDLQEYVTNNLVAVNELQYLVSNNPTANSTLFLYLKENLKTGTYKIKFELYDKDTYIGDVYKYLIIR